MNEVEELIAFYKARGWNWMLAAEFTLFRLNGGVMVGNCNCCRFSQNRKRRKP